MSDKRGKLTTCNRCGQTVFREYIGQGETDGGYTTWDKYEPLPESWLHTTEVGDLCPTCAGLFRIFIHKLMDGQKVAPIWDLKPGDGELMYCVSIKEKKHG